MALYLPEVTVKYIDWLIGKAENDDMDLKWIQHLQQTAQQQQRELRIFFLTVDALQTQYQEKYQGYNQLACQIKQELSEDDTSMNDDEQVNKHDEELLDFLEQQLHYWRSHATQQRDKKTKREQQYHQTYFFPVVNTHYQKKYIQARNKNNQVEQQLSDLHHAMDFVKNRLKKHRFAITKRLKDRQMLKEHQKQLIMGMDKLQQVIIDMKKAQIFWCQFDTQYIQPYLDLILIRKDREGDWWNRIRQRTLDYEHTQQYGLLHYWHHHVTWNINFVCTQCHQPTNRWPCLDKKTAQLFCTSCYQVQKIANEPVMINPQPSSPILATGATVSIPSLLFSSTTKSIHTLMNDCKPFVKKMKSTMALNSKLDLIAHHPILVSRYLYRSVLS